MLHHFTFQQTFLHKLFFFFFLVFFVFLGHMEVPRLQVKLELQLLA